MNAFPITSEPFDLGRGFKVEFSFDGGQMSCSWSPRLPVGKRARQLLPAYFEARHVFLTGVSERLGMRIACIDMPGGDA